MKNPKHPGSQTADKFGYVVGGPDSLNPMTEKEAEDSRVLNEVVAAHNNYEVKYGACDECFSYRLLLDGTCAICLIPGHEGGEEL